MLFCVDAVICLCDVDLFKQNGHKNVFMKAIKAISLYRMNIIFRSEDSNLIFIENDYFCQPLIDLNERKTRWLLYKQ